MRADCVILINFMLVVVVAAHVWPHDAVMPDGMPLAHGGQVRMAS
jgi:hypothetical protein